MLRAWVSRISITGLGITMNKRQLLALCLCSMFVTFNGTTTVSLMPVYAIQLGADATMAGIFVAASFLAVTLGNIIGGWLSDRTGIRKPILLISCAVWIPTVLLMTQATDIVWLTLATALCWLPGGIAIAMTNILTGLSAAAGERGKVFGWTKFFNGIGGLLAGAIGGPVAERWGWPTLFVIMAVSIALMLTIATLIRDQPTPREATQTQVGNSVPSKGLQSVGLLIMLLLVSHLLVRLSQLTGGLAVPLTMTSLGFNAVDVSSAIAFSAAITLPLPLLLGWLSDKAGRKRFLIFCYAIGAIGLLVMIPAAWLWHFWLSASLVAISSSASGVVQAYVADLVPPHAMGRGMSLFNTTSLFAGIVGLSGAGYVIQNLGTRPALLVAASLSVVAILLLLRLRKPAPDPNLLRVAHAPT